MLKLIILSHILLITLYFIINFIDYFLLGLQF